MTAGAAAAQARANPGQQPAGDKQRHRCADLYVLQRSAGEPVGFLDVAGRWDPSLAFVMVGAIGVAFVFFRIILKSPAPKFDPLFKVPDIKAIDCNLIVGSGIFGMGWGLIGFCPGPAISSLTYGRIEPVIFLAAMFVGFYVERVWRLRAAYG